MAAPSALGTRFRVGGDAVLLSIVTCLEKINEYWLNKKSVTAVFLAIPAFRFESEGAGDQGVRVTLALESCECEKC